MHDVHVCAQQSSNAGVELNISVWGGDLPTMAVEIFFLWTTLSPVRPESAVYVADYWGTDGNDQRKWTMFLVHPTTSASTILSKRNKKHRLKSEFIALNLRLHLLWHSCVHRQRNWLGGETQGISWRIRQCEIGRQSQNDEIPAGKTPKVDKSKRSISDRLKYSRRVRVCSHGSL